MVMSSPPSATTSLIGGGSSSESSKRSWTALREFLTYFVEGGGGIGFDGVGLGRGSLGTVFDLFQEHWLSR
jgi:hypothetical protein